MARAGRVCRLQDLRQADANQWQPAGAPDCDACKAIQKRERNRRTDARRKAERDAVKAKMAPPRCEQCGKPIEGANLLATRAGPQWARKFCGSTCRKAACRARNG